jgi:IclR family transcriptional regulator, acetate operon repressor
LPQRRASAVTAAPDGTLWACTRDGERWRVADCGSDAGWTLSEAVTDMAWDASGHQLALAAADSGSLFIATRHHAALRRLATLPKGSGRLAGLAADANGGWWSALRGGWSVVRFDSDGSVARVVALPVPRPSGVAIGGPQRDTLYVSSAREAVTREALEAAPLSGRLLVVHPV